MTESSLVQALETKRHRLLYTDSMSEIHAWQVYLPDDQKCQKRPQNNINEEKNKINKNQ